MERRAALGVPCPGSRRGDAMPDRMGPSPAAERDARPAAAGRRRSAVEAFIVARWRGEVPLLQALWWGMWLVGTTINLATSLAALLRSETRRVGKESGPTGRSRGSPAPSNK